MVTKTWSLGADTAGWTEAAGAAHFRDVTVFQEVVWHRPSTTENLIEGVRFALAKFMPISVSEAKPLFGAFGEPTCDVTGASNVKEDSYVPTRPLRVMAEDEAEYWPATSPG